MPGTQVYDNEPGPGLVQHDRIAFAWQSDASGNATVTSTAGTNGVRTGKVVGTIYKVGFHPGGGDVAPSANYDVKLLDEYGGDVLAGLGADLSNTSSQYKTPMVPATDGTTEQLAPTMLSNVLTLNVSNAGNAKSGFVVLYLK